MNQTNHRKPIGISGLAAYVPPYRVWLEDWCAWSDNQWPKIREVVGRSFRVRGPNHSVYTMAANAVIRLIDQYEIDPTRVKFLGLVPRNCGQWSACHHHLLIDTDLPTLGFPIPKDDHNIHFGDGSTATEITLEPGEHTLQLLLGDYLHIPHNPPVVSIPVMITVE